MSAKPRPGRAVDRRSDPRERSINILQNLYTVIAGLSLVTAVGQVVGLSSAVPTASPASITSIAVRLDALPLFVALLATVVPFYHGANRYLDEAYIFQESASKAPRLTAIVDLVFFFTEAIVFYAMSLVLSDAGVFFVLYIVVLLVDITWLAFVYFSNQEKWARVAPWLKVNLLYMFLVSVLFVVFIQVPGYNLEKWSLIALLSVVRSVKDYHDQWNFYFP